MTIKNFITLLFLLLTVSMEDRIRVVGNSATSPKMYYTEYDASQVQKNSGRLFLRSEILREPNSSL